MTPEVTTGNVLTAGVALLAPAISTVATWVMMGRKVRRENEADLSARLAPLAGDIANLQAAVTNYVPRADIDRADAAIRTAGEQTAREVGDLRERFGRLDERQQAADSQLGKLEQLVTKRFDKIEDCLGEISRKVG